MLNFRGFVGMKFWTLAWISGKRVSFDNPPPKSPSAREGDLLARCALWIASATLSPRNDEVARVWGVSGVLGLILPFMNSNIKLLAKLSFVPPTSLNEKGMKWFLGVSSF